MRIPIGNLLDWTITNNNDGTKKMEKQDEYDRKVTIHRALIHEDIQMIEPLQVLDATKMEHYSLA